MVVLAHFVVGPLHSSRGVYSHKGNSRGKVVVLAHFLVGPLHRFTIESSRGKVVVLAHFVVGPLHRFIIERMSPPQGPATLVGQKW